MGSLIETPRLIDVQALKAELEAIQPDLADQRKAAFRQVYPSIVEKMKVGVKEGKLVELLARQGILKSRATLKKWMAELQECEEATCTSQMRQSLQDARGRLQQNRSVTEDNAAFPRSAS